MSKNLSAKYYQQNKERLQKNLVKDINIFLKQKKENIRNFFRNKIRRPRPKSALGNPIIYYFCGP